MKVQVIFLKTPGLIHTVIEVVDSSDYFTSKIFEVENENGEKKYESRIWKEFPLTPEGRKSAQEWAEEQIEKVKKRIYYWREFELPQDKIITI